MQRSVSIVGWGNWGHSLAQALTASAVPLREVIVSGKRSAVHSRASARTLPLIQFDQAQFDADVLWLCVPDGAITQVTKRLVKRVADLRGGLSLQGRIVLHSSGALTAQALHAAAGAGARVASVHPLMSFPTRAAVPLVGVSFAVEADAAARRILNAMVRQIGGRPFAIKGSSKALYHAAGVLSSPLLVSHLAAARQAAELAGFSALEARRLIEPIARATLENYFVRGAGRSFSGPIARGDVQTIRLHLQALKPHPMLAALYRSLALYAVDALPTPSRKELRQSLRRK